MGSYSKISITTPLLSKLFIPSKT
ncbi:hypothetical protein CY0110_19672 [Crocosphaera chwakensis CCY0110]|uniref:Uncharacterized protein n=1 Tax=Crocosphaera chwakensis CCY0110 TaxID=391612 RepID=A3IJR6_9CHRO|nr:hypothetical protein CY0110_19672 [Crocosphaera chwakensis CCY0110]